jgi:hypothetical protein
VQSIKIDAEKPINMPEKVIKYNNILIFINLIDKENNTLVILSGFP